jgi:hypothetical protein
MPPVPEIKIIACQTVGEELKTLLPDGFELSMVELDFGLHRTPALLRTALQEEIDRSGEDIRTILLGYGLCASGVVGLNTRRFQLVVPRADDCIALFLGSREEYLRQFHSAPGTYYLTRGWIECGDDPYSEYQNLRKKYSDEKALRITKHYICNYTRLALIDTGNYDSAAYRKYAQMVAGYFDLHYEEIPGSDLMLKKMIAGDWDKDFIVVPPGETIRFDMFYTAWEAQ